MKKKYLNPLLRIIEIPDDDLVTASPEPEDNSRTLMSRRTSLWQEDDVW